MTPSNQTQNYELSQWEKSDKVLMEDFNTDNEKIDAALKTQADALAVESAARQSLSSLLNTSVSKLGNCQVESFSVDLNPGGGVAPTINFSAPPEIFFIVGNTFQIGSRHMTVLKRYYSSGASVTSDNLSVTWSGSACKLASASNGTYRVFAFYRMDQ